MTDKGQGNRRKGEWVSVKQRILLVSPPPNTHTYNLIASSVYRLPTLPVVKPESSASFLPPGLHGDVKVTACGQHVGWHHTGSRCQFRQKVMEDHVTIPDQNLIISFQVDLHDLKEDIQPVSFML